MLLLSHLTEPKATIRPSPSRPFQPSIAQELKIRSAVFRKEPLILFSPNVTIIEQIARNNSFEGGFSCRLFKVLSRRIIFPPLAELMAIEASS